MHEAVIVSSARTAIGTAFRGSLVDVDVDGLAGGGMGSAVVLDVPAPSEPTPRT